jgi:small GTP-binding protein
VKIWKRVQDALHGLRLPSEAGPPTETDGGSGHLARARESLAELLDDPKVPAEVRASLAADFEQVRSMLDKLEHGHIHIAVFGRVSVGKSALLNALLGEERFSTSPLHGETRQAQIIAWEAIDAGGVFLVDTPGINEVDGEDRERLAHEVAGRSDLVMFVVDGDITESELAALRRLREENRPIILVFNKIDRYTQADRALLLESLRARTGQIVPENHIVMAAGDPAERVYIQIDAAGNETELVRKPSPEVQGLRERLWSILEAEGKTLAALNASLFAGKLSDAVNARIVRVKDGLATQVIKSYCLTKGVLVGINPVPVSDLVAAVAVDGSMIVHLSRVYGMPISRAEAGALIRTIGAQMALVTGTVWAVNFVSSALKGGSLGLSTLLTASAQGAVAWYATYIVGQAAKRYFAQGKSWGESGPKRVVQDILASVDRDSLLAEAREAILARLQATRRA